jgi:hypothetical protein
MIAVDDYIAYAVGVPIRDLGLRPEVLATAPTLGELVVLVAAAAPGAAVRYYGCTNDFMVEGRPVCAKATGEPGRVVYLCGPAPVSLQAHGGEYRRQPAAGAGVKRIDARVNP